MATSGGKGSSGGAKPTSSTTSPGNKGSTGERAAPANPKLPVPPQGSGRANANSQQPPQGAALKKYRPNDHEDDNGPNYPSPGSITRYPPATKPPSVSTEALSVAIDALVNLNHRNRQADIDRQLQEKATADKRFCNGKVDLEIAKLERQMEGLNPEQRLNFLHDSTTHPKGEDTNSGLKSGQTHKQAADAHLNEVRSQTFSKCIRDSTKQTR